MIQCLFSNLVLWLQTKNPTLVFFYSEVILLTIYFFVHFLLSKQTDALKIETKNFNIDFYFRFHSFFCVCVVSHGGPIGIEFYTIRPQLNINLMVDGLRTSTQISSVVAVGYGKIAWKRSNLWGRKTLKGERLVYIRKWKHWDEKYRACYNIHHVRALEQIAKIWSRW